MLHVELGSAVEQHVLAVLQVKPIVVADMLANASRSSGAELSSVTTAVQGFLNNVVAAAGYGTALETPEQLKQSVAAAVRGPRASLDSTEAAAVAATNVERSRQLQGAAAADGKHAAAAAAAAGGGLLAVDEPGDDVSSDEDDDKDRFHLAEGDTGATTKEAAAAASSAAVSSLHSSRLSDSDEPGVTLAPKGPTAATKAAAAAGAAAPTAAMSSGQAGSTGSSLLAKDAFLVFRALCKLSIRTSDSVTVSDPTAVRGKVSSALCLVWAPAADCCTSAELEGLYAAWCFHWKLPLTACIVVWGMPCHRLPLCCSCWPWSCSRCSWRTAGRPSAPVSASQLPSGSTCACLC